MKAPVDYVDLDIDLLIDANSNVTVLDREDYERSIVTFGYPAEVQANVERSLHELLEVFENKKMPGLPELFATSNAVAREPG
jgi:protein associated with RNAse G/E